MILTANFLSIWYQKVYKNQCYRSSVYSGSNISLDSFDSEGYLRPKIDDIYDEVLKFFSSCLHSIDSLVNTDIHYNCYFLDKKEKTI